MRILLLTLMFAAGALAQEKAAAPPQTPAQGPPPKNLTKLPDGHFSANSDPKDVENYEIHVVAAGDTLSGISREILKDGKLWPQIWEQNEHIVNPHWIYPNDKVLIRPVTKISEATPPADPQAPPTQEQTPEVKDTTPQPLKGKLVAAPYPNPLPPAGPRTIMNLNPPPVFPEVKEADLNCSGFIRIEDVPRDVKVIGRYSDNQALASDGDYLYIDKGVEGGVRPGAVYQVVRPTKNVSGVGRKGAEGNLGMHYLEVAQVQIVIGQADHALARITQGCEAVEKGDVLIPYTKTEFPALPSRRPFSGTMKASGQVPGNIVMTKDSVMNSGSPFGSRLNVPAVGKGTLRSLDRGVVGEGGVVYLDVGKRAGAKPGDLFIVFRDSPASPNAKTAIAEVVILKVEDRASTALVTYSDDVVSLGDVVDRR